MLNRTLRTSSATQNGLNLGTRSFAAPASFNFGRQTLRLRHAHPSKRIDSMRLGITGKPDASYPEVDPVVPVVPSSPPVLAWPTTGLAGWARVMVVAEAPPAERQVITDPSERAEWPRQRALPEAQPQPPQAPRDCLAGQLRPGRGPGGNAAAKAKTCKLTLSPVARPFATGG